MASKDSTGGATPSKGKADRAVTEVGGVRSSDDPVPDLWSGQPAEERRDATCSAEVTSSEGRGDGPQGLQAPNRRSATANHAGSESVSFPAKELGKPDAGKPPVRFDEGREADGHWPSRLSIRRFPPTLHSRGVPTTGCDHVFRSNVRVWLNAARSLWVGSNDLCVHKTQAQSILHRRECDRSLILTSEMSNVEI